MYSIIACRSYFQQFLIQCVILHIKRNTTYPKSRYINYWNMPFKVSTTLEASSIVSFAFTPSIIFITISSGKSTPIIFSITFTGSLSNWSLILGFFGNLLNYFTNLFFNIHFVVLSLLNEV